MRPDVTIRLSTGTVADGSEAVRIQSDTFLLEDATYSAQLFAVWHGRTIVDLVGSPDLYADPTMAVFSASVLSSSPRAEQEALSPAPDSLSLLAFNNSMNMVNGPLTFNDRKVRRAGVVAIGGVGSARGLAGVYAAALGMGQEPSFMSNETIARMSQQQVYGIDRILGREMFFAGRVHEAAAANGVRKLPSLRA